MASCGVMKKSSECMESSQEHHRSDHQNVLEACSPNAKNLLNASSLRFGSSIEILRHGHLR